MTIKELIKLLKKYNKKESIKIKVRHYSSKKDDVIDITYEDIETIENIISVDQEHENEVNLCITNYKE